jgi:tRNA (guanine37-N1)-methyltransferase
LSLFTILTLFPDALEPYLCSGVLGSARKKGLVDIRLVNFRDWSRNRHRAVDDRPFGGGPGMVLKPEPIVECVEWIEADSGPHRKLALCPGGRPFVQQVASELATEERILLLCGRYEGFDQRIFDVLPFEHLSLGDFVLSGGELPAMCVVDAVVRLLPGALGNEESARQDSFQESDVLDHPHYTRPRLFRGHGVPPVLLDGDHGAIEDWRRTQAVKRTKLRETDGSPEDN